MMTTDRKPCPDCADLGLVTLDDTTVSCPCKPVEPPQRHIVEVHVSLPPRGLLVILLVTALVTLGSLTALVWWIR